MVTQRVKKKDAQGLLDYLKSNMPEGQNVVILMHDAAAKQATADALPMIIEYLISEDIHSTDLTILIIKPPSQQSPLKAVKQPQQLLQPIQQIQQAINKSNKYNKPNKYNKSNSRHSKRTKQQYTIGNRQTCTGTKCPKHNPCPAQSGTAIIIQ